MLDTRVFTPGFNRIYAFALYGLLGAYTGIGIKNE